MKTLCRNSLAVTGFIALLTGGTAFAENYNAARPGPYAGAAAKGDWQVSVGETDSQMTLGTFAVYEF